MNCPNLQFSPQNRKISLVSHSSSSSSGNPGRPWNPAIHTETGVGGTWDPLPGSLLFSPSHGWLLVVDLSPTQVPVDLPEKMIPKCHIQPRVPLSRLLGSKQFPSFAQWGTVMGFYLLSARKLHSQGSLPEDQKVSPYSSGQQGHPHSHWEANQLRICWASRTDNPMS
jgi:hypothetical protein